MPSYAEDDTIDYENEIPDFQDETELDDYLNDEEFDLMNDLFPKAIKEMEEYQGWNNLAVKLAIFDADFNLSEALIELKKAYKKKKKQSAVPPQPAKNANGMYYLRNRIFFRLHGEFLSSFQVYCFLRDFLLTYLIPLLMCQIVLSSMSCLFKEPRNSKSKVKMEDFPSMAPRSNY